MKPFEQNEQTNTVANTLWYYKQLHNFSQFLLKITTTMEKRSSCALKTQFHETTGTHIFFKLWFTLGS